MITHGEDVEIHALRTQGWSVSAIARHLGLDRKTVRAHLAGGRQAGVRASSGADPFDAVADYVRQRLVDDPHVRATVLFGEVVALGYGASYPTFVRRIRHGGLRPSCEACSPLRAHTEFLEQLLTIEVDATEARRLAGRMRFANFPVPLAHRRLRLQRPAIHRPRPDPRPRHMPLHRRRHQRVVHRPPQEWARPCSPSPSATKPSKLACASTTAPPPTSPQTPLAPTAAGILRAGDLQRHRQGRSEYCRLTNPMLRCG